MSLIAGHIYRVVARQGLAADVPTLLTGEIGWDTDTKTFRVGDLTADPPKVMSTKSTGPFAFPSVSQFAIGGVTIQDGKVDGVSIAALNQFNGFLVRKGTNLFGTVVLTSGDNTLSIFHPYGDTADPDLRVNIDALPDAGPAIRGLFQFPATEDADGKVLTDDGTWVPLGNSIVFPDPPDLTKFLRSDNTWAVPAGGGGGGLTPPVEDADLAEMPALSIKGRAANSVGVPGSIVAAANNTLLVRRANALVFGRLTNDDIDDGTITVGKFANIAARSLLGNPTGATAAVAAIGASADGHVMRRDSGLLGFGQIGGSSILNSAITNGKLANADAYAMLANNTAQPAAPAYLKMTSLQSVASPLVTDFLMFMEAASGKFFKSSLANAIAASGTGAFRWAGPWTLTGVSGEISNVVDTGQVNGVFAFSVYSGAQDFRIQASRNGTTWFDLPGYAWPAKSSPGYGAGWATAHKIAVDDNVIACLDPINGAPLTLVTPSVREGSPPGAAYWKPTTYYHAKVDFASAALGTVKFRTLNGPGTVGPGTVTFARVM